MLLLFLSFIYEPLVIKSSVGKVPLLVSVVYVEVLRIRPQK